MNKIQLKQIVLALLLITGFGTAIAFDKNSLVYKRCVRCHAAENGKLTRVEDMRTTPEEWTVIVDRMARLHGMRIEEGEMAIMLKQLNTTQILTPDEAARVAYIDLFNNPQTIETPNNADEEQMFATCVRCHSAAKIYSYRMTAPVWEKLREFHLYIVPTVMYQMREMHWLVEADTALKFLSQELPYGQAWTAPDAKPDGDWLLLGDEPGKGTYRGRVTITATGDDDYALQGNLSFSDGTFETIRGEATLYGGYALRTRARQNGSATMGAFNFLDGVIQGTHHHKAPDFRTSSSSWYPVTGDSRVLRATPGYLLSGEETKILIEGVNLPQVKAKDISVSVADAEVLEAKTTSPETIEVLLVYRGSDHGRAAISVKGAGAGSLELALAPGIDYLQVSPSMGRARLNGGVHYPAEGVQFQAFAYSAGADGDDPADDFVLGPVEAAFSLAEEETRHDDDDLVYAGAIEADGTYLPIGDYAPIPAREYGGEGSGLVKVIATYMRGETPYTAEGRLAITVPDYIERIK